MANTTRPSVPPSHASESEHRRQIANVVNIINQTTPDYSRTAAEISAGVTPVDYRYPEGNVRRYGAVGNGVADDTQAIQAALDAAAETSFYGGSVVSIPPGYYRISRSLIIPREHIYIIGAGADTTAIRATADFPLNEYLIRVTTAATDANPVRRWGIHGLMLDGRHQADGIGVIDSALVDFDRLIIRAVRHGIVFDVDEEPSDITKFQPGGPYITNCRFDVNGSAVIFNYGTQLWIMDCWFVASGEEQIILNKSDKTKIQGCEFNGWGSRACIKITSDDPNWYSEKHLICGNTFYNQGNGDAVLEEGFARYNYVYGNSAWQGEGFTKVSPSSIFQNNLGRKLENEGNTSVSVGTTSRVVTHGLDAVPTFIEIMPTNTMGNATKWWVTDITSTTFTLRLDADPTVGAATFRWRATAAGG